MATVIRPDAASGLFETVLVLEGRPIALRRHLQRLASSAATLYGATLDVGPDGALESAARLTARDLKGPHRLRVLAAPSGRSQVSVELETQPASSAFDGRPSPSVTLVPTVIEGGLGPHKWRDRSLIERRRAELGLDASSHILITDTDGTVLETERANVVALLDGALVSPAPDGRLLAGVTVMLAFGIAAGLGIPAEFRPVLLAELEAAGEVFCTSAVMGLTPAAIVGCRPGGTGRPGGGTPITGEGDGSVAARLGPVLFESWQRC